MAQACGVSLRASDCTIIMLATTGLKIDVVASTKIKLADDRQQSQLITFREAIKSFAADHAVESMVVKGRAPRGKFVGGTSTFKMEALIQSVETCDVRIVLPQTVAAFLKKNPAEFGIHNLFEYYREAFEVACYSLSERA